MAGCGWDCKPSINLPPEWLERPIAAMAKRLSLDEGVDLFLDHVKVERGLARHTLDAYGRDLARTVAFLVERGRRDVDDVTAADLTDLLIALADGGLSARSRARALVAIRQLFRYLVGERWIEADPAALIDSPRIGKRLPGVLGVEAVERLDRGRARYAARTARRGDDGARVRVGPARVRARGDSPRRREPESRVRARHGQGR